MLQRLLQNVGFAVFAVLLVAAPRPAAAAPAGSALRQAYGRLPLTFEANQGQAAGEVAFLVRAAGSTLFLTGDAEAVLRLDGPGRETSVVRWRPVGGTLRTRVQGEGPLAARSHYLHGDDPRRWQTGVAHYDRVRYQDVYPGIDLVYHADRRQLEYDFVIAPQADPGRIRVAFEGVDELALGARGELVLTTAQGRLVQPAPEVYQERGGRRQRVAGRYVLAASGREVSFALGPYDRTRPLVIDPVLVYSTFLGGSGSDGAADIAVDTAGNAYVVGTTESTPFPGVGAGSLQPALNGESDLFLVKINPSGTAIVYATYLGGSNVENGHDIAVDAAGNVYLTGRTFSTDLPGVGPGSIRSVVAEADAFVTKIDPTGAAIVYSTLLGGDLTDAGNAIAVDGAGNAYVTGETFSPSFTGVGPGSLRAALGGISDAFVTKIDPAGMAILYSTYLGGISNDTANDIAVDSAGNAYVTGQTPSPDFTGVGPGSLQPVLTVITAFITKIDPAGTAVVYSTFLGSLGDGTAIAADAAGNAYVAGFTGSATFPGVGPGSAQPVKLGPPGVRDGFVTKIDPAGTAILYSTFLGGTGNDMPNAIAVDGAGNAVVVGSTASLDFPVTPGALQPAFSGTDDGFVTQIDAAGTAFLVSTYLGGNGFDSADGVALDAEGSVYVTGVTSSTVFPGITAGSIQPVHAGISDAFVVKIGEAATSIVAVPTLSLPMLGALALLLAAVGLAVLRR